MVYNGKIAVKIENQHYFTATDLHSPANSILNPMLLQDPTKAHTTNNNN